MSLLGQFFFTKRFHTHKKHKNAYKQTKTKKAAFFMRLKTSKGEKVAYSLICVFVFFVLFVLVKSFRKKTERV